MKHGKKYNDSAKLIETGKFYDTEEAVAVAVKTGTAKFDETVEIHAIFPVDECRYISPVGKKVPGHIGYFEFRI